MYCKSQMFMTLSLWYSSPIFNTLESTLGMEYKACFMLCWKMKPGWHSWDTRTLAAHPVLSPYFSKVNSQTFANIDICYLQKNIQSWDQMTNWITNALMSSVLNTMKSYPDFKTRVFYNIIHTNAFRKFVFSGCYDV